MAQLAPLPLPPQEALLFAAPPDLGAGLGSEEAGQLAAAVRLPPDPWPAAAGAGSGARLLPRLGRGGRLWLDRCAPWASFEPGSPQPSDAAAAAVEGPGECEAAAEGKDGGDKGGRAGKDGSPAQGSGHKARGARARAAAAETKAEPVEEGARGQEGGDEGGEGGLADGGAAAAPADGPRALDPERPLWEQPNPYAEWLGRSDLAAEALARLAGSAAGGAGELGAPATLLKLKVRGGEGSGSATPGGSTGSATAATPGTTAATRGSGTATRGVAAASRATPGTAGSAARGTRGGGRPPKAPYQRSNLGPG